MADDVKRPGYNEVPKVDVDFVFKHVEAPDGGPPELHFVEVECGGRSVRIGRWVDREDGFKVLRVPYDRNLPADVARLLDGPDKDEVLAALERMAPR